jgi:hypothetical protein
MNYAVLTPERGERIARLINEMSVSDIMCREMTRQGEAARAKEDWAGSLAAHERWRFWWNDGFRAQEELISLGIPVVRSRRKN